jgi:ferredoxin-nitrate reductase
VRWSTEAARSLVPFAARYGERQEGEPERLDKALLVQRKPNGFDLLRDLHDLWLLVNESLISVDVMEQAAHALRDEALLQAIQQIRQRNKRQGDWLRTRIRQAAPQVLVVPS